MQQNEVKCPEVMKYLLIIDFIRGTYSSVVGRIYLYCRMSKRILLKALTMNEKMIWWVRNIILCSQTD